MRVNTEDSHRVPLLRAPEGAKPAQKAVAGNTTVADTYTKWAQPITAFTNSPAHPPPHQQFAGEEVCMVLHLSEDALGETIESSRVSETMSSWLQWNAARPAWQSV